MRRLTIVFFVAVCFFISTNEIYADDLYKIGISDVLDINVIDYPNLKTIATVASDGTITFPYIGTVSVRGMKLSEVAKEITRRLSEGYVKYPVVSVSLIKSMSRRFFVSGEVARPGEYPYDDDVTVIRAISLAGGIPLSGLYGKVKIRRKQKGEQGYKEIIVNLKDMMEGNVSGDVPLQQGDMVIVERNKTFFIHGEVGQTGEFILREGTTVVKALSEAGGLRESGRYGKVKIRRKQNGEPEYKDIEIDYKGAVEGDASKDMSLQPDDIIIVERNKTYFIYGEVNKTGEFILQDDMTVFKAITTAGGFTKWGSPGRVKILRPQKDKGGYETIKVNINAVIDGDAASDVILQPGDTVVVTTGVF